MQTRGLCHLPYGPDIFWHCLGWTMTHGLCSYRERRPGLISPGESYSTSERQLGGRGTAAEEEEAYEVERERI